MRLAPSTRKSHKLLCLTPSRERSPRRLYERPPVTVMPLQLARGEGHAFIALKDQAFGTKRNPLEYIAKKKKSYTLGRNDLQKENGQEGTVSRGQGGRSKRLTARAAGRACRWVYIHRMDREFFELGHTCPDVRTTAPQRAMPNDPHTAADPPQGIRSNGRVPPAPVSRPDRTQRSRSRSWAPALGISTDHGVA